MFKHIVKVKELCRELTYVHHLYFTVYILPHLLSYTTIYLFIFYLFIRLVTFLIPPCKHILKVDSTALGYKVCRKLESKFKL